MSSFYYQTSILGEDFIPGGEMGSLPATHLYWCKEHGFSVVSGPEEATSLIGVKERYPWVFPVSAKDTWDNNEPFAKDEFVYPGWLSFRKDIVPGSSGLGWTMQKNMVHPAEVVPSAVEFIWFLARYLTANGKELFTSVFARTNSQTRKGEAVHIGITRGKIEICCDFPESTSSRIGIVTRSFW